MAGSAQALNIVNNGSFETGDFTGWTQTGNTGFAGVTSGGAPNGTFFAFFGPIGADGGILQTLSTVAGNKYVISFSFSTDGGRPATLAQRSVARPWSA